SGYWNMILLQGSKACELDMGNEIIEIFTGQPIFREAGQGESIRMVSHDPFHKVLLLFIPKNEIPREIQLSSFLTKNERDEHKPEDSRILIKIAKILALSQHNDYINQLKLHTSLAELFIYQLEKIRVLDTANISEIKKNHYEKIQLVKNLIDADFSQNHTIAELAKKAGTNEQYLKKYFKLCFGKTVMNYTTQVKMEQAKKLILE